ncbi:hypothetical protein BJV82DRAFT_671680 [Fennellomyces sp. T-0311]|nr:hypothetical protein BJV82DRAFT_671680 [Fennellomyces sp. T-0311]
MHENDGDTTTALESLSSSLQALSHDMTVIAQSQVDLRNAFMQRPTQIELDTSNQQEGSNCAHSRTIIRKPTNQKDGLTPIRDSHIKDLIRDSDPARSENQVEGVAGSIKHYTNVAIKALKQTLADGFDSTWTNLPPEKDQTVSDFEGVVRHQFGVPFDSCEASWAANHLLSERWDNKSHYRARRVGRGGNRRGRGRGRPSATSPPVDSSSSLRRPTREPSILPEAPSPFLSIPTSEPRMDQTTPPTELYASPTPFPPSSHLNNQQLAPPSHVHLNQQQQYENLPNHFSQYQPYLMAPEATNSGYSRLLQAPYSPTQQVTYHSIPLSHISQNSNQNLLSQYTRNPGPHRNVTEANPSHFHGETSNAGNNSTPVMPRTNSTPQAQGQNSTDALLSLAATPAKRPAQKRKAVSRTGPTTRSRNKANANKSHANADNESDEDCLIPPPPKKQRRTRKK